ncbi:hypothetical protein BKA66DRAFT_436310 [Pyrenochaeta sp. MPI-SDFR-AT-0127]|nr:hypothetical protein BKA66DRAFT_436310 [Pyrenochaeta sp. MPI-SDFR-AT-0127]
MAIKTCLLCHFSQPGDLCERDDDEAEVEWSRSPATAGGDCQMRNRNVNVNVPVPEEYRLNNCVASALSIQQPQTCRLGASSTQRTRPSSAYYPLRPPSFRFLTPTGRFEVNREICLSISGHHEETWQPAWGLRTALVAIRSFMDTDAKGQLGGIECSKDARERMAKDSGAWTCAGCAKSNADIMTERETLVKEVEEKEGKRKEEEIPEELRLAYRDELREKDGGVAQKVDKGKGRAADSSTLEPTSSSSSSSAAVAATSHSPSAPVIKRIPPSKPLRPIPATQVQQLVQPSPDRSLALIDTCIYGVVAALLFMVLKKFL